ncbi:NADP-dependent oxidoreductase [Streptomyces hyaluromycini]|uniref:NADP-dependent oxidoreductase n=1 Tax=Streptomyces hyaluromycini TaxID=1377993 RepID=UPI000B5CAFA8|nr:NADP-dependent oxidoreductase [Streptomyces hyaluromycini]
MKAIIYRRYGGPEVPELAEVEPPKVHVDSVLVRVRAAAVNPADLQMREGLAHANVPTCFPVIPGWDIAGVVEEAGPGAPEFRPGDEVVGYVRTSVSHLHGGYTELVSTDVPALAPKPDGLGSEQAAALPLTGLTAYQAVTRVLDVQPGESLLVYGAAGGGGSMADQIAAARGTTVLGADAAQRDDDQVTERVRALVPEGVDAVFDTVGRGTLERAAAAGHDATRYASTVDIAGPDTRPVFARLLSADLHAVTELAATGRLFSHIAVVLPLEAAADAHRLAASPAPAWPRDDHVQPKPRDETDVT